MARSSASKDRVRALNQLRSLISTAPEELRAELGGLSIFRLVNKAAGLRPNDRTDVVNATKLAMRSLARRVAPCRRSCPGFADSAIRTTSGRATLWA